jgi:phospholysine phosphohistidine inorganic pyrophosphate phosphatase
MSAILFDMDGVLYEGDVAVSGAAEAIAWCRAQQIPHLFLTNTTSRPRAALVEKLADLGIPAGEDRILTPPVAAAHWLRTRLRRDGKVVLFVPGHTRREFSGLPVAGPDETGSVAAVVVGDLGREWDFDLLNRAFRLLISEPRPVLVALGLTRYWRAGDGLRLDTGPFVKALEYAAGIEAVVMGKPAGEFFAAALEQLGAAAAESWMIGDDIRADIEAAQRAGLRGVLVRTGKFRAGDLETGIVPDAVLDSIARLPDWWQETVGQDRKK